MNSLNAKHRLLASSTHEKPLTEFHGHVVPLPNGVRVKCGGPNNVALRCAVCAREHDLLAAGQHPMNLGATTVVARVPFKELPHQLELKIGARDPELIQTLLNFLGAVSWCGQVGHSATISMYVDGDGAGQLRVEGVPKRDLKLGGEMADAAANYGDSLMVAIGPNSAQAYTTNYDEGERTYYTRTTVYPKAK